jgi:hypothetical protein
MATVYGDQYQDAYVDVPSDKIRGGDLNGTPEFLYFSYTASGAIALNDVIKLGKIPKGARVIEAVLSTTDLGTVGTLDLGWAADSGAVETADQDGFIAAMNVNSAANTVSMVEQVNVPGLLKKFSAECDLQITASAATDAAGTIKGYLMYVRY